jgi:hypothetical protein
VPVPVQQAFPRGARTRSFAGHATGATTGQIHLGRSKDAPHKGSWYECELAVVGTGLTPEGDSTFDSSGQCIPRGA